MSFYIGVDCGTQGTKVIIYDAEKKRIVAVGNSGHKLISDNSGLREQDPRWWIDALDAALRQALASFSGDRHAIAAIGVSGQQHGLVVLDKDKNVLCNAKLWNDTETAADNDDLVEKAGGTDGVIQKIGTAIPVGYTASKLVWLKRCKPDIFSKIAYVINPKDYINYYLTGVICTDIGSASGLGYFDVLHKDWNREMIDAIDSSGVLLSALPPIVSDDKAVGSLLPDIAKKYGLSAACKVAAGSGDNMTAAVGTGIVKNGVGTINLGTSGVLSVYTDAAPSRYPSIIQIQNLISNSWIPTVCTMNATSTTTAIQNLFALDLKTFDAKLAAAQPGADGIIMLPFFNGERMPPLPHAKGSITGLTIANITQENIIRAAAESVAFGLRWGYDLLKEKGIRLYQMAVVGGGSNSEPWRQIIADIFQVELVSPENKEAGSLGAVILAMSACGEGDIQTLCEAHVSFSDKKIIPKKENAARYEDVYNAYLAELKAHYTI